MSAHFVGLAVIAGTSLGIGAVYANRLGLNRQQSTTDSSIREALVGSSP